MRTSYILADGGFDALFGWNAEQPLKIVPRGISEQEYRIVETIHQDFGYTPTVRDVFVVKHTNPPDTVLGKVGKTGRINVHSRVRVKVNLDDNSDLVLGGDYLDELNKYLTSRRKSDRIVVAYSEIGPQVKADMERLIGAENVRAHVFVPEPSRKEAQRAVIRNTLTPGLYPDGSDKKIPKNI